MVFLSCSLPLGDPQDSKEIAEVWMNRTDKAKELELPSQ